MLMSRGPVWRWDCLPWLCFEYGHPMNSGGEAMWGSVHHPLLFHPFFCLGQCCAGDVRIEVLWQCF
jgi:hypothetical protein